jgi:hypothetical protein
MEDLCFNRRRAWKLIHWFKDFLMDLSGSAKYIQFASNAVTDRTKTAGGGFIPAVG